MTVINQEKIIIEAKNATTQLLPDECKAYLKSPELYNLLRKKNCEINLSKNLILCPSPSLRFTDRLTSLIKNLAPFVVPVITILTKAKVDEKRDMRKLNQGN